MQSALSLVGKWWSRRYGCLDVKFEEATKLLPVHLYRAGSNEPSRCHIVAHDGHPIEFQIFSYILRCDQAMSNPSLVFWVDATGDVKDCWDKKFLEQISRSAEWCNECKRMSEFDKGMEMMDTENLTESQQTVGLCLTTKNRLWQLQRALPLTLLHA